MTDRTDRARAALRAAGLDVAVLLARTNTAHLGGAASSVIEASGYGEAFVHRSGRGLGLEVHKSPRLHSANDEPLPENAVVTVEPGVYLCGYGYVRIEDDVVVPPGEHEMLTHDPIGPA